MATHQLHLVGMVIILVVSAVCANPGEGPVWEASVSGASADHSHVGLWVQVFGGSKTQVCDLGTVPGSTAPMAFAGYNTVYYAVESPDASGSTDVFELNATFPFSPPPTPRKVLTLPDMSVIALSAPDAGTARIFFVGCKGESPLAQDSCSNTVVGELRPSGPSPSFKVLGSVPDSGIHLPMDVAGVVTEGPSGAPSALLVAGRGPAPAYEGRVYVLSLEPEAYSTGVLVRTKTDVTNVLFLPGRSGDFAFAFATDGGVHTASYSSGGASVQQVSGLGSRDHTPLAWDPLDGQVFTATPSSIVQFTPRAGGNATIVPYADATDATQVSFAVYWPQH